VSLLVFIIVTCEHELASQTLTHCCVNLAIYSTQPAGYVWPTATSTAALFIHAHPPPT